MGTLPQTPPEPNDTWQGELRKLLSIVTTWIATDARSKLHDPPRNEVPGRPEGPPPTTPPPRPPQPRSTADIDWHRMEYIESQNHTLREANRMLSEERAELKKQLETLANVERCDSCNNEIVPCGVDEDGEPEMDCPVCLANCQLYHLRITSEQERNVLTTKLQVKDEQIASLKAENQSLRQSLGCEDHWVWSDKIDNDLESIGDGMRVSITGGQLQKLVETAASEEKSNRIKWQDMVYHAMNMLDKTLAIAKNPVTEDTFKERCDRLADQYTTQNNELRSAWRNRNHFCSAINEIAKMVGMNVESAAPDAVVRNVKSMIQGFQELVDDGVATMQQLRAKVADMEHAKADWDKLVHYFRHDAPAAGQEGDDAARTPVEQILHIIGERDARLAYYQRNIDAVVRFANGEQVDVDAGSLASQILRNLDRTIHDKIVAMEKPCDCEAKVPTEMIGDTFTHCPACGGQLDTGWECNDCGSDWRELAYPVEQRLADAKAAKEASEHEPLRCKEQVTELKAKVRDLENELSDARSSLRLAQGELAMCQSEHAELVTITKQQGKWKLGEPLTFDEWSNTAPPATFIGLRNGELEFLPHDESFYSWEDYDEIYLNPLPLPTLPEPVPEVPTLGHLVEAVPPFVLHCATQKYQRAVVVSEDPLVLVSSSGDMLWQHVDPKDVKDVGSVNHTDSLVNAFRRYVNELKQKST